MTAATNPNPNGPQTTLYDAVDHQYVAWEADETTVTVDNSVSPPITYAKAAITGGGGGGGGSDTQYIDGGAPPTHPVGNALEFNKSGAWQTAGNGAGNGFPVQEIDGANVTQGAKGDPAATDGSSSWSVVALLKGILTKLLGSIAVTGTFWQATQPVSGTVTANAGTNLNTAALALETGGNLATLVTNTADLLADGDHLATIDSGIASLITNTADLLADGDNLATISTNTANIPAKGAAATSASTPVNIASDQVVPIKRSTVAVYTLASTTTSGTTQNSSDLTVGPYTEISLDINTTAQAGTNPTIQYFYERKGADGLYYVLWQSAVLTAATNTLSTSIGAGMAYNQSLGVTGRLRWVIGGTATPTFTHSLNIYGK